MAQKIAIIEDDAAISQMYRIKFEAEGYKVDTADNGFLCNITFYYNA
jgi:DNA-binding response OmpR family regulator